MVDRWSLVWSPLTLRCLLEQAGLSVHHPGPWASFLHLLLAPW